METWDAIRARRNVRTYQDRAIPDEDLGRILEAARRTPSSINQQAWDFVVVTERDRLRELATAWRYSAHVAGSAATIALVVPDSDDRDERDTFQYDVGQVTMSIMLAATDLGIGAGTPRWATRPSRAASSACPRIGSARSSSRSAIRPTVRSSRSHIRTGGSSTMSSTVNVGSRARDRLPARRRRQAEHSLAVRGHGRDDARHLRDR